MKKLQTLMVTLGLLAATPASLAQSTMTDGLVIKIDPAAGKITIDAQAIELAAGNLLRSCLRRS